MSGGREEGGGRVGPAGRLLGAWGPGTGVLTVTGGPWALRAAGPSAGRGGRGCCTPPGGGQRRRPPVGAGRCDLEGDPVQSWIREGELTATGPRSGGKLQIPLESTRLCLIVRFTDTKLD